MGNNMLKYYLDTNAVRSLASRLDECANIGAFISVWTICEMLVHIIKHPEDFGRIRSNFCSIKDSKIRIITKTPDELHYSAFSLELLVPINSTSKNLIIMALQTLEVETYEEWMNKIKECSLWGTYQFVKAIDEATPRLNQNIEKQYNTDISMQESIQKYEEFVQNEDKELTHQRLQMGILLGLSYEECKQFLCNLYNGSVDLAFRVNACVVDKKVSLRQKFRRNDDTDMMHLYYVQNDIILVTDDRVLRENVIAQYPERAISVEKFKGLLII